MRSISICLAAVSGISLLWLFGARSFSLLVDRVYTVTVESRLPDRFRWEGGGVPGAGTIELSGVRLDMLTPKVERSTVAAAIDASGRVSLVDGGKSFPFGPGRSSPSLSGLPDFEFTADAGDTVRFTIERCLIGWPTPFEMNFMTGSAPLWKRHVYCRLVWTKRSRARLEMLWRFEQGYFSGGGWRPAKIEAGSAGLLRTSIAASDMEDAVARYLARARHWSPSEYHLESRGPSADGREEVIMALHRDDERSAHPKAGSSVELRLGYESRKVVREIGGQ